MPEFSVKSDRILSIVDPELQRLFRQIVQGFDCTVLSGKRTLDEQHELVAAGRSKTLTSKHLTGDAVDVMPWPVDWHDTKTHYAFCGYVRGVAGMMGIEVRGGHDWDRDWTFTDQTFHDIPHWEILKRDR